MAGFFSTVPTCVTPQTTVQGCLNKVNFFDRAYLLSLNSKVDCQGNPEASYLRDYAIYDTIICGEGEDPNMWGLIELMFGANAKGIPSTSAWRATWCRPDYSFTIKNAVSGGIGQPVQIELTQSSYSLDGTAAVPVQGSPINLPGLNFPVGMIQSIDRTSPFNFLITIAPFKKDQAITLRANQRLFPNPGARLVTGGSCPVDETSAPMPGLIQHTAMVAIRADWCVEKELNEGYDGVLQFAPAPVTGPDGQVTIMECWDAVAAQVKRKAMKITRDQLLLMGNRITNPDLFAQVAGYEGFEGYIPSVLNGGGIDYTFDPFTGFNIFQGMRAFARFAEANRRCREYTWFVSPEFRRGITDSWNSEVQSRGLGVCIYDAFSRAGDSLGMGQEQVTKYLGYESYYVDSVTVHIKTLEALADNTAYGIPGYAFNNMAMVMPSCPIKTTSGATASPIEIFYPETECASGGYEETMVDEWTTTRCRKLTGSMIQKFAAMYHCVQDHAIIRASVC